MKTFVLLIGPELFIVVFINYYFYYLFYNIEGKITDC